MTTEKKATVSISNEVAAVLETLTTKSAKIRFLSACEFSRGDISRILNIRYQHVRNVLISEVKSDNSKELAAKVKKAK